jgi:hypothetical protein
MELVSPSRQQLGDFFGACLIVNFDNENGLGCCQDGTGSLQDPFLATFDINFDQAGRTIASRQSVQRNRGNADYFTGGFRSGSVRDHPPHSRRYVQAALESHVSVRIPHRRVRDSHMFQIIPGHHFLQNGDVVGVRLKSHYAARFADESCSQQRIESDVRANVIEAIARFEKFLNHRRNAGLRNAADVTGLPVRLDFEPHSFRRALRNLDPSPLAARNQRARQPAAGRAQDRQAEELFGGSADVRLTSSPD